VKDNRRWLKATLIAGLWVGYAGAVFAQSMNAGDIRGIVTDTTGAAVPGVSVTVVNKNTGVAKELITNQDGLYDTSSIVAGSYEITFSKAGFSKLVRSNITVDVGDITINAQLSVGAVTEQVIVNTDVPLLKTENAEQSTTLEAATLQELPEVGQDWQHFTILLPGATGAPGGSQGSADPQQVASINGNLPFSTILADGASVTLPSSANADVMVLETVQEVRIGTSAFSAQYGVGGLMFNQISKGGTNNFHGAAYEYFQNTALNAASYSFGTGTIPVQHYNNFGGSIGGPILKKKMFFYFNYDKINNKSGGSPSFQTMPTTAFLNGDFTAPGVPTIYDPATTTLTQATGTRTLSNGTTQTCPCYDRMSFAAEYGNGNRIPASRMDPLAKNIKAYYPAPNTNSTTFNNGYPTNNFVSAIPNNQPFGKYFGRLDWDIKSNNRLTLSIIDSDNPAYSNGQGFCPINCQSQDVSRVNSQITDVWTISPNVINELRMGYTNQLNFFVPATLGQGYPAKLGWQYAKADIFPIINVTGFYQLTSNINAVYKEHVYDPSDVVTLIRGKHIIHFGGEYLFFRDNSTAWGNTNGGTMGHTGVYTQETQGLSSTGLSFADFLLGQTQNWNANVTPEFGGRIQLPQLFVQDDFKVTPNLTLNLGLRYQIQSGWGEVKGNMRTFDPTVQNPATGTLGAMWYGSTHANGRTTLQAPVYNTFLPRVGFSWSPMPNTVLRGGFGLYAYNWSLDTYGSGMGSAFGAQGSATDATNGVTPVLVLSSSGSSLPYVQATTDPSKFNGATSNVSGNMYHTPVGGSYQWNLEGQHQITNNLVASLAYVASHGHDLPFPVDINQIPENRLGPNDVALGYRPYPQYGAIAQSTNNGISNYNSLQATINKRMSNGLDFNFNYTWSHFLDNIDSSGWGSRAGVQSFQSSYNVGANYSNSNFDVRNAFKGSAVYQLPFGKGRAYLNNNTLLDEIVGGWQATGTLVLLTGQPFTVTMKTNNSYAQAGQWYPNLIGNPRLANRGPYHGTNQWINEAAFAQPANGTFGNFRRNTLYGPGLDRVNFSLGKTFAIHEAIGLQIRADANNLFNHPSFGLPGPGTPLQLSVCANSTSTGCSAVGAVQTGTSTIRTTTVGGRTMQLGARLTF
jgi:Carboxypeptidase regulatory-like domain/TonB dependent receptor